MPKETAMSEEIVSPEAPAAAPAPEKSNKEKVGDSFTAIFIDKLKEQSFTILIMLLALYYQHNLWQADKDALSKEVDAKEERILQVVERERDKGLEREKVLEAKIDQFVELLKSQAAWQQAQSGHGK
jgi:hypothetical protein